MSNAMLGYGSVFQVQTESSPDNYVDMAEVNSITPPSFSLDQVDVTHMASPNRNREFISGLNDPGECSFDMNFIPGNASDDRIFELLSLPTGSSRARNCRVSFPNGDVWLTVSQYVTDPKYLTGDYTTSMHFKHEADGSKWKPAPCVDGKG